MVRHLKVRVLRAGRAEGELLVSRSALSFYGGVDLETGRVCEPGHELEGEKLAGRLLALPTGKGSTVGSYALYRLAKAGLAPSALLLAEAEPIVVTGAILAGIPCVDGVPVEELVTGWRAVLDSGELRIDDGS